MTPVATRDGSALGSSVGPIAGCWRGKMGGRDKRRASFWRVGGWFHVTIAYGSGGSLPYIPRKNLCLAKACHMATIP